MLKTKLVDYQLEIVQKTLNAPLINGNKNFLISAKPGLGKSFITIAICYQLIINGEIDNILWASPANLIPNLKQELEKHVDKLLHYKFNFISHEKLSSCKGLDKLNNRTYFVVDEAHRLKNVGSAKRSMYTILHSKLAYGTLQLTGTPKGVHFNGDLYALLLLLGFDIDKQKFEYRFCLKSKMRYISSKNTEQLMGIIEKNSIWVDKSVLNLPIKNHHIIDVPISQELQKMATDMAIHNEVEYEGIRIKKGIQSLLLLNSGYLSGMTDEDGNFTKYIGSNKPQALLKLLKEIGNEQILIFCYFHIELELIATYLNELDISFVTRHGHNTVIHNNQSCLDFVANNAQVMLTTIPSSEMGLTFTNCRHTIYYNISQSPTQLEQSQDRTHRFGQEADCQYYYLSSGNLNHGLIEIQLEMIKECDKMFKMGGDVVAFDLSKTMLKLAQKTIIREEPRHEKTNKIKLNTVEMYKHAFEDVYVLLNSYVINNKPVESIGQKIRSQLPELEAEYVAKKTNQQELFAKSNKLIPLMQKLIIQPDLLPEIPEELKEYEQSIYNFLSDNNALIPIMCNQFIGDESIMLADTIPLLFIDNETSKLIICDWTLFEETKHSKAAQKMRLNYRNKILMSRTKLSIKDNIYVRFKYNGTYDCNKI